MSECKRDALKCKNSAYTITQDTILSFCCYRARFRYEYPPGTLANLDAMAIDECETCPLKELAPIIPEKTIQGRQIAAYHESVRNPGNFNKEEK